MDRTKQLRVDNVLLQRGTDCRRGHLDITQHHLVFWPQGVEQAERIPYALFALVTRQASLVVASSSANGHAGPPPSSKPTRIYPLQIRFRTFDAASLGFESDAKATEVFEALKVRVIVATLHDLYAFHYQPPSNEPRGGWAVYDFKQEFARQGLGKRTKAWRFTDVNAQYQFCPTYPANLAVPTRISDATLQYAAKYRSKARIPALTYLHWANNGSITRCAQPLPGLKQARSVQDEKVVEAIFTSHLYVEDAVAGSTLGTGVNGGGATAAVYGATTTNVIIDARPTTNAVATYARGGGTENMDHYRGCKKAYMGIENIHVMRDSINRVVEALRAADEPTTFGLDVGALVEPTADASVGHNLLAPQDMSRSASSSSSAQAPQRRPPPTRQPLNLDALRRSNWLRHISTLLDAVTLITRNVHIASSHCLIHCSDGWDRTSQLAALAQVCLDPYYRTMRGFAVLVEKDWLSFGHRFADRCGHGGAEKHFVSDVTGRDEGGGAYDEGDEAGEDGGMAAAEPAGTGAQAAANAFWGFTKQLTSGLGGGGPSGASSSQAHASPHALHQNVKETSPVFTQFLDCVWQIQRHFPSRFEFTDQWLVELHREVYECRFGTFLANCDAERRVPMTAAQTWEEERPKALVERTASVWDHLLSEESRKRFGNERYRPELDDPKGNGASDASSAPDMGVLLVPTGPNAVRWWPGLWGQRVQEANAALDFEESERQRRKAEKARWEAERLARKEQERLEKEEMERRAREMTLDEDAGEDGASGSTVAINGGDGPGGTVDLVTASGLQRQQQPQQSQAQASTDGLPLSYQAREPRRRPPPPAQSAASSSSAAQNPLQAQQQAPGDAAAAAALRFKSWAMGGWDRFQGAMAGALPASPPQPLVEEGDGAAAAAWGTPRPQQPQSQRSSRRYEEAANPWADDAGSGTHAQHHHPQPQQRQAPPQERASHPSSSPSARAPTAANPWRAGGGGGTRSNSSARASPQPPLPNSLEDASSFTRWQQQQQQQRDRGSTEVGTGRERDGAGKGDGSAGAAPASDPLGVGPL